MRFVQLALSLFTFIGTVIAGDTTAYPRPLLFSDHKNGVHAKTFWDHKGRIRIITAHRVENAAQQDFVKLKLHLMHSFPGNTYPTGWAKKFDKIDVDIHRVSVTLRSVSRTNRKILPATKYAISLNLGASAPQLDPLWIPQPYHLKAFAEATAAFMEAITSNFNVAKELMSVLVAEVDNSWKQGHMPDEGPDPRTSENAAFSHDDTNEIPPYNGENTMRPPGATQEDMDRWWAFYWSEMQHNSDKLRSLLGTTEQVGAFLWDRYWALHPPVSSASSHDDTNEIPPYNGENTVRPPGATQEDMDRWWAYYWSEWHQYSDKLRSLFGTTEQADAFLWDNYWDLYPPASAPPPASGPQTTNETPGSAAPPASEPQTTKEDTSNSNTLSQDMDWSSDWVYRDADVSGSRN